MVLEELIIKLRLGAEGFSEAVGAAKKSMSGLSSEKAKLSEEIKLRLSAPEIVEMQKKIRALAEEKERLAREVRVGVNSEELDALRMELLELKKSKDAMDAVMTLSVDTDAVERAEGKLADLQGKIKKLDEEIKIKIKADKDQARAQLAEVEQQMTSLGEEVKVKINASGVDELKARLDEVSKSERDLEERNKSLEGSYKQIGVTGAAAFWAIIKAVQSGINTFVQFQDTMMGFEGGMRAIGVGAAEAQSALEEINADKLMDQSDVMLGIKNLTAYGMSMEQATVLMGRLKDSATTNRQAHYSLSEAVKVTTEGIKNENSVTADAVGVTKNIAKMMDDYAKSLGRTTESLTQAERAQAVFNGFMEETEAVAGQAAHYADKLGGTMAQSAAASKEMSAAFGEAMAPMVKIFTEAVTAATQAITGLVKTFPAVTSGVTIAVGALAGFAAIKGIITLIQGMAGAWKALSVAMSVGSPAMLTITAALAIAVGLISAFQKAKADAEALANETKRIKGMWDEGVTTSNVNTFEAEVNGLRTLRDAALEAKEAYDSAVSEDDRRKTAAEAMEAIGALREELRKYGVDISKGLGLQELFNAVVEEGTPIIEEYDKALAKHAASQERLARIDEVNAKAEAAHAARLEEVQKGFEDAMDAATSYSSSLESAASAIDKVAAGEKLTLNEMQSMLKAYPELNAAVAKYGMGIFNNADALREVIESSRATRIKQIEDQVETTQATIRNVEMRIKLYQLEYDTKNMVNRLTGARMSDSEAEWYNKQTEAVENNKNALVGLNAQLMILRSDAANLPTGGSSGSRAAKTAAETAKELYDIEYRSLQDRKGLREMNIDDEISVLSELREKYAGYAEIVMDLDKQIYSLRRTQRENDLAEYIDDIRERSSKRNENVNFSALIDELEAKKQELMETLADYPETLKAQLDKINDIQTDLLAKRIDKINASQRKALEDALRELDKEAEFLRALSGVKIAGEDGAESVFEFNADDEISLIETKLKRVNNELEALAEQFGGELSKMADSEFDYYNELLDMQADYEQQKKVTSAKALKDQQKAEEDARKDLIQNLEKRHADMLKAEQKAMKDRKDAIKELYDYEIERAKDAANEEIAVLQAKIRQIEDIMQAMDRAAEEEDFADKIRRLTAQLEYEVDDSNRYELQKEIDNITAERTKTLRKQALQDEKASLSDQIAAVRDNANARVDELQKARDAEIKANEDAFASFEANLLKKKELDIEYVTTRETLIIESNERIEKAEAEYAASSITTAQKTANKNESIMKQGLRNVLSSFESAIAEFAELGRRQGAAYAEAFRREVESISGSGAAAQGANAATSTSNAITNNFYAPVASYSEVNKATERMSELLARG